MSLASRGCDECPFCGAHFSPGQEGSTYFYCTELCAELAADYPSTDPASKLTGLSDEFEQLVRDCYLHDALTIDETYRNVQSKLPDGDQYIRDDIEEYTDELLRDHRAFETRVRNMDPEDLGLSPIGEVA